MASKFVRSIRSVKNLSVLSDNVTDENDLVSDLKGNVFVRTINGFVNITEHVPKEVIEAIQKDIEDLKVTNQVQYYKIELNEDNIKKLQTQNEDMLSQIETLKKSDEDLTLEIETLKTEGQETNEKINSVDNKLSDMLNSTGWVDIVLSENVEKYNNNETPQYKILSFNGEETVYIRGSVKGITERNTIIGNIPLSRNLDQKHTFTQVCTLKRNEKDELYTPINRWEVTLNGDIELVLLNIPPSDIKGTEWCPISTNFTL